MSILMLITGLILAVTLLANFFIIAVIVKSSFKKVINQLLAATMLGMFSWSFFILLNMLMPLFTGKWSYVSGDLGYFFEKLVIASALVIFSSDFWFIEYFLEGEIKRGAKFYILVCIQALVILSCFVNNIYFTKITVMPDGYSILDRVPFNIIITLFIAFHIIYPLIRLKIADRKETDVIRHNQNRILFSAFLFALILGTLADWIMPVYFKVSNLNALGPTFTMVSVGAIVYSINRYRFLDIRSVVQRSVVYAFSLSFIIVVYVAIIFFAEEVMQQREGITYLFSAGLTAVVGIFGSRPIEKHFSRLTDKIFFKDKYNYSKALHELSEVLNINLDQDSLLRKMSAKLEQIFKTDNIEMVIKKDSLRFDGNEMSVCSGECPRDIMGRLKHYHQILLFSEIPFIIKEKIINNKEVREALQRLLYYGKQHNFEVYVPILLRKKAIAMLLLGPKLSGDPYTNEDLNLLNTFSYQAAIALEKSRLYEAEKKYAAELEKKVRSRTAKIEKLQKEQKQMMIDISHGLQTPLAIIKGESEFLQEEMPDNQHIKNFEKSIDQVSKFIYDMLNLARLETTDENFRKDRINLSDLLEELVEYFDVLVKENNIKIEKNIEPNIFVMGWKEKLEEMVNNLVSNSIKYIDNERIIRIKLKKDNNKAAIIIEDTGMGVSPSALPMLFGRFYRVRDEKHSGIKGTGIGLSIVKQIAEKHGGTIRAESEEGKWTRMTVKLDVAG